MLVSYDDIWGITPFVLSLWRMENEKTGTMRMLFLSKGYRLRAPLLVFVMVIAGHIWVSGVMEHPDEKLCYIAYGVVWLLILFKRIIFETHTTSGTVLVRMFPDINFESWVEKSGRNNSGVNLIDTKSLRDNIRGFVPFIYPEPLRGFILINEINSRVCYAGVKVKSGSQQFAHGTHRNFLSNSFGKPHGIIH
ncbi:MAG: hypothetical protein Q8904_14615 [Bacteroidota bacterium]|nr:hypothetical protein [Bacteroidota bacterium]